MLLEMETCEKGFFKPLVARANHLERILATGITLAAKRPNSDWSSFKNTLRLDTKTEIIAVILCSFSIGHLNSIKEESIVMPKNSIVVVEKTVFSCASDTPKVLQILIHLSRDS